MKKKQGFASMTKERLREVTSMGGKEVQKRGTAHKWTSEEAKIARSKWKK